MLVAEKKKHQAITDKIGHEEYPYMLYGGPCALPGNYRAPYAYPTGQPVDMLVSSCSTCMHNPIRVTNPCATVDYRAASLAASTPLPPLSLRYHCHGGHYGLGCQHQIVEPLHPVSTAYHCVEPFNRPSWCTHTPGCHHGCHHFPAICQPTQVNMPWIRATRGMA